MLENLLDPRNLIGRRVVVVINEGFARHQRIVDVREPSGFNLSPLYILDNGQWLTRREFRLEEEKD